ncbi:MAG: type II toxin-antitoxin system RelE/ParE family toxin [Candidatus Coproplasma sp.]
MACKYYFTEKAESDLEGILSYITNDLCSPMAARNLGRKIFESIDNVCLFPDSGVMVQNEFVKDAEVRRVLIDNYVLYYKQKDNNVTILRIIYAKRNLDEIIKLISNEG